MQSAEGIKRYQYFTRFEFIFLFNYDVMHYINRYRLND